MSPDPISPATEHPEFETVAEYPSVSRLAVLSLVLAVLGCGAIFSPLLVCAAVAAALTAAAALWSIARAEQPMWGRRAAIAALLISVLVSAWGITWRVVREQVIFAQARQQADKWLELVQAGHLHEAHQLHLSHENRQVPGADLAEYYRTDRDARFEYETFLRGPALRQILDAGPRGQLRFLGDESLLNEPHMTQTTDVVTLRYALDAPGNGPSEPLVFLLLIARRLADGGSEAEWELRGLRLPK